MSYYQRLQTSVATANARQLAIAFAAGVGSLYLIAKLLRELAHVLFPSILPGESNTALLASPRPKSTKEATAEDLANVREYDYVVVGTGTAGCVLANRLSEDPNVTVLAIESGHSDLKQIFSRIPAGFARLFRSAADHDIWTTKQTHCGDRKMQWPRGKMIGGCSSINAMIYNKGSPDDYDEWVKLGNPGWGYKDLLPLMNKAEGFTPSSQNPIPDEDLVQHGRTGPWKTGYSYLNQMGTYFLDAMAAVGIPTVADLNTSRGIQGGSYLQTFIDTKGQRSSAAVAYLTENVVRRPNLKIASGQSVTRVIFEHGSTRSRAVGVEMAASKASPARYLVKARREVIVSAGAVHTPHILKLSGIGPSEELIKNGISVIADLKGVGANLADHIFGAFVVHSKVESLQWLAHPVKSLPALVEWLRFGTGAMTTNVADAAGFLRTADRPDAPDSLRNNDLSAGPNSADLEILAGAAAYINHGQTLPPWRDYYSIGPIMLRPSSRGTVTLASADPFQPPIVDANYLATQHDRDMMTYGMRLSRQLIRSTPFKALFDGWYWPRDDCDSLTDEELLSIVRNSCETIYHPMCTASMGPDPAKGAVVDARLRVHGVDGLRVADASVFPQPVACHPCAPVVMTGEKAAQLVKEDWAGK